MNNLSGRSNILTIMLLAIIFSSSAIASSAEKILYVAKNGNDAWSGSLSWPNSDRTDGPLATLEGARDKIRILKSNGKLSSPVTVQVRGGTYYRDKAFVLDPQDSGSKQCPVTYTAHPGEEAVISGGKKIDGEWKVHKGKIIVCTIPEVKNGKWYFNDLFVNGKRQTRARTPNDGFIYMADLIPSNQASFKYKQGELKRWRNLTDIRLVIYHEWDLSYLLIKEIDEVNNIVTLIHEPHKLFDRFIDPRWFDGKLPFYYVDNVFEGLDSPGEWYLDRATGNLYYWPQEGESMNDLDVIAPAIKQLILVQGDTLAHKPVSHVTISGFKFCDTDWPVEWEGSILDRAKPGAVTFSYAAHCIFNKNTIMNIGTYGVDVLDGSSYITIDRNKIFHTGSGGINVAGKGRGSDVKGVNVKSRMGKPVMRNTISNNHIHHCGEIFVGAAGISLDNAAQNTISHNHIHDVGYNGLRVGGPGNVVEFNLVHHVMLKLNDGAGIYVIGENSYGTLIRNNVFHDIHWRRRGKAWGIYLDNWTEHVTVMDNIVYRTSEGGAHPHGARWNKWLNNIFVDGKICQIRFNTYGNHSLHNIFERNIVYWKDPNSPLIRVVASWQSFQSVEISDYNLFYCVGGGPMKVTGMKLMRSNRSKPLLEVTTYEEWRNMGYDFHSIVADPLFVDPENDDYTLREDSPAFKLGFRPIDISTVGIQD